ncbi:unnamed protein product [Durusdinium trenchii]|uniref:peptidylprolyl isomerase n=2 Tax=Durusdinium trenchii TaxID=1381693 RepID=A0ABP0PSL1_9DINO
MKRQLSTGLRWLFLAFLAQRWTQWAFLAPGQFSGRRALLGSVGASWSLAALEAHAEEDVELELKVLRTGKTPYAKMDYQVFREGKCQEAQIGDLVRVKHRAWFDDFEEGMPWELTLVGRQEVGPYQQPKRIKVGKTPLTPYDPPALTDALVGMHPGELRRVVVPPEFGFGSKGRSIAGPQEDQDIPPNATTLGRSARSLEALL